MQPVNLLLQIAKNVASSNIRNFKNLGQSRPLLFIFHCKAFYNNDLQTWHSVETFPHLWQVVFAFRAYLSSREGILGRCHRGLLALQDGEVTIITQTIEDTMFLSKLHRFIRVVWFTMLKVSIGQKQKSSCEDLRNYNRNNFCDRTIVESER